MQKKVLIALFLLLSILLGAILANLLNGSNTNMEFSTKYHSPSQEINKLEVTQTSWAKEMANSKNSIFSFPVNELFMQIDLKTYIPPKIKSFRLVINRSDRYSLFCVVQTLSSLDLPYILEKKNKISSIYVGSKTKKSLDKVVDTLKSYDIKSKIIEVWL